MMEVEKTVVSEKFVKPSEEEVEDLDIEKELEEEAASKENGDFVSNGLGQPGNLRVVKRAKRSNKSNSFSEDNGQQAAGVIPAPGSFRALNKNSRRPRHQAGRGLPKKNGGGGKGTWGKLGDELNLLWVDKNDPNYDSDEELQEAKKEERKVISLKPVVPEMSEEDVRKTVEPLILEYFENLDYDEVIYSIDEILANLGARRWMVVSIAIELSMDHKPSHREMTSQLVSELYLKVVSQRDIGKALDYLLKQIDDLELDTPEAPTIIGNFIARAIADDCIPPKFLHSYKGHVESAEARKALCRAENLLSMKHGMVRLDNVWGVGGSTRPVKYLVKQIQLLLQEYLCSCDIKEATRCLTDLEVPHFHHELVYEAIIIVIESMHEKTEEAMCKLLQSLFRSFVITIDQMREGFQRVYDEMAEIFLDVPAAYTILERWVIRCRQSGIINDDIVRRMPSRGRKRFVSEGDGGAVKEPNYW